MKAEGCASRKMYGCICHILKFSIIAFSKPSLEKLSKNPCVRSFLDKLIREKALHTFI